MNADWLISAADALSRISPSDRARPVVPATIHADDLPLGAYVLRLDIRPRSGDIDVAALTVEIDVDAAELLLQHLTGSIRAIYHRQIVDTAAGRCDLCRNTRMIHPLRHGRPSAEHCPTCTPKITAARAAFRNGTPPT